MEVKFSLKENKALTTLQKLCKKTYAYLQPSVPPQRYKDTQKAHPGKMKHNDRLKG